MINLPLSAEQEVKMTSIDFLNNIINPARLAANEKETRYTDFIKRVIDELDLGGNEIFVIPHPQNKKSQHCANLDYDQMMLVGMRESKNVRRAVLEKLKGLSAPKEDPIVLLARQVIALDEENKILAATKAQINDKRTATLMNKASQDAKKIKKLESQLQNVGDYKSLTAVGIHKYVVIGGKNKSVATIMKKLSIEMDFEIKKVEDSRYGFVNTYHIDVIEAFKAEYL